MLEPINLLMLVEDDENDIIITKRKITRSIKVNQLVVASTLEETKKLLTDKSNVDVILLDLNLPDSQGLSTVETIRSYYNGAIVVLTSIDDEIVGIQAIRQGADEYLVKNQLTERLLSDAIYHAIERRKKWARIGEAHQTLEQLNELIKK